MATRTKQAEKLAAAPAAAPPSSYGYAALDSSATNSVNGLASTEAVDGNLSKQFEQSNGLSADKDNRGQSAPQTPALAIPSSVPTVNGSVAAVRWGDRRDIAASATPAPATVAPSAEIVAPEPAPPVAATTARAVLANSPIPHFTAGNAASGGALVDNISEQKWFVQQDSRSAYRVNLQSPPLPKVLTKFRVIRTGDQVRVVDADGSVYEGSVIPSSAKKAAALTTPRGQAATFASAIEKDAITTTYAFKVTGRNRTLNKTLSFEATNVLASVSADSTTKLDEAIATEQKSTRSARIAKEVKTKAEEAKPSVSALGIEGIHGWVNVGGTNEFQVEAIETR